MILWFVALPLAIALLLMLLHRLSLTVALLSTITFLAMAIRLLTLREVPDIFVFGRLVTLGHGPRLALAFCFGLLALVMAHAYRVSYGGLSYALTLGAAGLFAASLMVQNSTLRVMILLMGAIPGLILIPTRERRDAILGVRALTLLALSGVLLLVGTWTMEAYAPEMEETLALQLSMGTMIIGFAMLMGVGPFGLWLTPLFRRGAYLAGIMLHVVLGGVLLFFLGHTLQHEGFAEARQLVHVLLLAGGITTCLTGGLGAAVQRSVSGALSYAALADLGMVLIALGLGSQESVTRGVTHFFYRTMGITTVAMVAGFLRHHFGGDNHEHLAGIWQRAPLLLVALTVGGFSLAGLPPTAGFVTRLSLYQALAAEHAAWIPAILVGSLGPGWAFGRCVVAALRPPLVPQGGPAPRYPGLLALPLSLSLLALGIYPQLLTLLPRGWTDLLRAISAFVL
jgi:formate hydrogenlyase subunit 3/multisubunit Na+/H+ antiporter MnhD subunit